MYSPNILITNFCNQNCSFCFASVEMKNVRINREMELANFEDILRQIKKGGKEIDTVKLLGGEPTLHSRFEKIISLSLKYFPHVQIFTNGILPEEKKEFLKRYTPKVKFTFNVMTPGYQLNKNIRENVIETIKEFAPLTEITLSLTFDMHTDITTTLDIITQEVLRIAQMLRLGFANPVADEKNYYHFQEFPRMGDQLYKLVKYMRDCGSKAKFSLNCGFTRCMFTSEQYEYIKKNGVDIMRWGCFGKASSMDINPKLQAFHCFPLSTKHRLYISHSVIPAKAGIYTNNNLNGSPIKSGMTLAKLNSTFLKKRYEYWKDIYLSVCQKCPFYGHIPDKCPGPCIAFRMNSL